MVLIQSLTLGTTCVNLYQEGIDTVFQDGTNVWAEPQDEDNYRATAERLGYGNNTLAMCQDHELAHTVLAVLMGLDYSHTLWGVAHGAYWPHYRDEEAAVLAFQTYCQKAGCRVLDIALANIKGF